MDIGRDKRILDGYKSGFSYTRGAAIILYLAWDFNCGTTAKTGTPCVYPSKFWGWFDSLDSNTVGHYTKHSLKLNYFLFCLFLSFLLSKVEEKNKIKAILGNRISLK